MAQSYRQYLQGLANGTGLQAQEARALLQVVGDDFNVDNRFEANPYGFTGAGSTSQTKDSGHIAVKDDSGELYGYGPEGMNRLNDKYALAYQSGAAGGGGTGTVDRSAVERAQLKARIGGRGAEIDQAYGSLFGDLDNLVRSRDSELEEQYGGQLKKAGDQYAEALPLIDQSYAALGSYDSTQRGDSRGKAKTGFEDTTKTIGSNKQKDKDALGQYKNEQAAKFTADRDSAKRAISTSAETTDVDALRGLSNDLDTNLSQTGVTRATLGTNGRQAVSALTQDSGRYDAAVNALDSILKSSMAGDVKQAAVQAVTDSAGLSDEEKKKVQAQFGNTYAEQAAL